jgi:hypothetical protein
VKLREQLEYAAKAMGIEYHGDTGAIWVDAKEGIGGTWNNWNPRIDQADSDRMACKLRLCTSIFESHVFVSHEGFQNYRSSSISHDGTDEDVCRAVREARLAVAVEIGKGMK